MFKVDDDSSTRFKAECGTFCRSPLPPPQAEADYNGPGQSSRSRSRSRATSSARGAPGGAPGILDAGGDGGGRGGGCAWNPGAPALAAAAAAGDSWVPGSAGSTVALLGLLAPLLSLQVRTE